MGTCFGHCLISSGATASTCDSLEDIQHKTLIDHSAPQSPTADRLAAPPPPPTGSQSAAHINFIYRIMRGTQRRRPQSGSAANRSKFLERFWALRDMRYTRLTHSGGGGGSRAAKSGNGQRKQRPSTAAEATDIPLQCLDAQLLLSHTARRAARQARGTSTAASSAQPSPASSSLDLEWEHEAGSSQRQPWLGTCDESEATSAESGESSSASASGSSSEAAAAVSGGCSRKPPNPRAMAAETDTVRMEVTAVNAASMMGRCRSRTNSWSHRSTPDSLEWDVDETSAGQSTGGQAAQRFGLRSSDEDLLDTDTMELLQEIEWLKNQALSETGHTAFREPPVMLEAES